MVSVCPFGPTSTKLSVTAQSPSVNVVPLYAITKSPIGGAMVPNTGVLTVPVDGCVPRESVNRALRRLADAGNVSQAGSRIVVRNPSGLRARSDGAAR